MTRSDIELGVTLTQRVTSLTTDQIVRLGWLAASQRLVKANLLSANELVYRKLHPGLTPLHIHRPGAPFTYDEARSILADAKNRQQNSPEVRVVTIQATQRAFAIWGDAAKKHGNPFSHSHDHILSEVFLRLDPGERSHWRPELIPVGGPTKGIKVPDAAIVDDTGEIVRFHEAVSANYPVERLLMLAEHADAMLWDRGNARNSGIYFW